VLALRTSDSVDGPRIRSVSRLDAVKACMWATQEASVRVTRTTVPTRFKRAG